MVRTPHHVEAAVQSVAKALENAIDDALDRRDFRGSADEGMTMLTPVSGLPPNVNAATMDTVRQTYLNRGWREVHIEIAPGEFGTPASHVYAALKR